MQIDRAVTIGYNKKRATGNQAFFRSQSRHFSDSRQDAIPSRWTKRPSPRYLGNGYRPYGATGMKGTP
jgi:hypothetical protein